MGRPVGIGKEEMTGQWKRRVLQISGILLPVVPPWIVLPLSILMTADNDRLDDAHKPCASHEKKGNRRLATFPFL